jgi:hypothetical protein
VPFAGILDTLVTFSSLGIEEFGGKSVSSGTEEDAVTGFGTLEDDG